MAGGILSHAVKRSNLILLWGPYVGTTPLVTCSLGYWLLPAAYEPYEYERMSTLRSITSQIPKTAKVAATQILRGKRCGDDSRGCGKVTRISAGKGQ
jgi:hypothetical protein